MNHQEDLKTLWNMQEAETLGDPKALLHKAVLGKNRLLRKFIFSALLLVATAVFLLSIWLFLQPRLFITKLGITFMIAAIGMYLTASQGIVELLYKKNNLLDLKAFANRIREVKQKQKFLQGSVLRAYFILLSLGIFLYMVEYTLLMSKVWQIVAYGLTLFWILFNWFYIRPRAIKKQQAGLDRIIDRLEQVILQFEDRTI